MRPSELLGISGEYEAWCVDEAVYEFGSSCEAEMANARSNAKGNDKQKAARAENALRKMLGVPQKFRDIGELRKG